VRKGLIVILVLAMTVFSAGIAHARSSRDSGLFGIPLPSFSNSSRGGSDSITMPNIPIPSLPDAPSLPTPPNVNIPHPPTPPTPSLPRFNSSSEEPDGPYLR